MTARSLIWLYSIAVVLNTVGLVSGPAVDNPHAPKKEGLYSNEDDVIILNKHNMKDRVYGKSMVWMVEFYNSWCGHCINFAPTWKQIAKDLKGWRRVLSVGAVDCSTDDNLVICREYNIDAYPSLVLIPPNFSGPKEKGRTTTLGTQDKLEIKYEALKYITNPNFTTPSTWPRLKPLRSLGDIWDEATEEHRFVVVVFEEDKSVVGAEVILDLVDYPGVLVRTMLKRDVEKFGIKKYPALYIINKDSSFQHLASGTGLWDSDRHRFVDKLLSMMGLFDSEGRRIKVAHLDEAAAAGRAAGGGVVQMKVQGKQPAGGSDRTHIYMQDLESALHYAFRQEIAICKTIEGPKLDALRGFVAALVKFFPGRAAVTGFLKKVVHYLEKLDTPLTGDVWVRAIDRLQDNEAFLPSQVRWVGCRGSQPRYRGYPCGMWTMFHTLTVAAFNSPGTGSALEVPMAIRNYMEHFFGCHECSKNFLKMAAGLKQEIHRPLDAIMWLWSAHNKANKRLHADASEDPQYPKIQFPSSEDCPKCRIEPEPDPSQLAMWNSSAVALFLIQLYSKDSIVQDASALAEEMVESSNKDREMDWWEKKQREADLKKIRELHQQKKQQRLEKRVLGEAIQKREVLAKEAGWAKMGERDPKGERDSVKYLRLQSSWGFNQLDIGVCMAFYVICAVIIVFLYYHFIVKKRFKLPFSSYLPV